MNVSLVSWLGISVAAAAAGVAVPVASQIPRTVDSLPTLAWWFLVGWSLAGWVIASLKPAVIAMNDGTQPRSVAIAGVVSTLVASLAFGTSCGLYLLTEATWDGKALAALYGYLGALFGGFTGMRGMEFVTDMGKGILERWASKGKPG